MKRNDIASILIIVIISFTAAYFIGNAIFNTPDSRSTQVEKVSPIGPDLEEIDTSIFNTKSVNPTQDIEINQSDTDKPFAQ